MVTLISGILKWMKIKTLIPRMIFDSRGVPTLEVDCYLDDGSFGRASVPSGASTGAHEAHELRDGGNIYGGKGVTTAIRNVTEKILPHLLELDSPSQKDLDTTLCKLDGTTNKSNVGANTTLAVSLSFAKAVASSQNVPLYEYIRSSYDGWPHEISLPMPLLNVLNGGRHAKNSTDVQEWMIVPIGATSFGNALELSSGVYTSLREIMGERGSSAVGDEGGFPLHDCKTNEDALILLTEAVTQAGLVPGKDIAYALDVASSEFFTNERYHLTRDGKQLSEDEMIDWLSSLVAKYPIISIEDGLAEDSWGGWAKLTSRIAPQVQIVGDDLFVTNTEFIKKGIDMRAATAVLIKPNQIGTLSETVDAIVLAQKSGLRTIISHRSGETEDTTIAHLAVASGAGQIKTGSLSRSERLAKYNELLRISEKINTFVTPY